MRRILQVVSWLALVGVIVPPLLYLGGGAALSGAKTWMLVSTVAWFVTVPLWMGRAKEG